MERISAARAGSSVIGRYLHVLHRAAVHGLALVSPHAFVGLRGRAVHIARPSRTFEFLHYPSRP